MSLNNVESEKGVVWMGEAEGIGFVLAGGLVLALVPGAAKVAGAVSIFCGGVCGGIAEAHQGNMVRVQNIGLNYEETIRLLAGDKFLEDLQKVETNEEFRELFSTNGIPCREGLYIVLDVGRTRDAARTIAGSRIAPGEANQLREGGRERNDGRNDGECTIL